MLELAARLRARVLRLLGLASTCDLPALETRLDTMREKFGRQTAVLEQTDLDMTAVTLELEQMRRMLSTRGGGLSHIERNVHALIRRQFVDHTTLPFPHSILAQRFHIRSQNEEDGITLALIDLAGTTNRRFLELGAGINGGNSGFLVETFGWTGLMVDGSAECAARVARRFARYGIDTKAAWITRDNVNQLACDYRLDGEIDLLSLDLDGNDYWVWRALDVCSPRMVILEFNHWFGAERAVTTPYDPEFTRDKSELPTKRYYGASLAAFEQLGREKGYRLVMVEPSGVNAYLLRNDVAPEIPASPVRALHPHPDADAQPLLDQLAKAGLPLVDVASGNGGR